MLTLALFNLMTLQGDLGGIRTRVSLIESQVSYPVDDETKL